MLRVETLAGTRFAGWPRRTPTAVRPNGSLPSARPTGLPELRTIWSRSCWLRPAVLAWTFASATCERVEQDQDRVTATLINQARACENLSSAEDAGRWRPRPRLPWTLWP